MQPRDWDEVQAEVDRIVEQSPEPFDPSTVANARELISICRVNCTLPTLVAKGYWSTVSLSWQEFEIEVFEDRFEVFHFSGDKSTDIWYEMHQPSRAISKKFLDELLKLTVGPNHQ